MRVSESALTSVELLLLLVLLIFPPFPLFLLNPFVLGGRGGVDRVARIQVLFVQLSVPILFDEAQAFALLVPVFAQRAVGVAVGLLVNRGGAADEGEFARSKFRKQRFVTRITIIYKFLDLTWFSSFCTFANIWTTLTIWCRTPC